MSSNKLKIATISHDIVWSDKSENIITVAELLNRVDCDTDIVVLPELFCTGFISTAEHLFDMAESNDGDIIVNIHRWAQFFKFAICGSFIAKENGKYLNRAFFIEPSGESYFYDKRHLDSLCNENKILVKGNSQSPIIRYRGWNLSMQICFDIYFPVWCKSKNNNVDLVLIPSNCPNYRKHIWKHLLISRAVENQVYIVGANRSGSDDFGEYDNSSFIYNYCGECISEESLKSPIIKYATLSKTELNEYRANNPFYLDADLFNLTLD